MRSVECLVAGLDALAGEEVAGLPDAVVRADLVALLVAVNRLSAEVARRVAVFDARGLAEGDGCRSTAAWLRGFGRLSGPAAGAQVKRVRVLRALPELAAGAVSSGHGAGARPAGPRRRRRAGHRAGRVDATAWLR